MRKRAFTMIVLPLIVFLLASVAWSQTTQEAKAKPKRVQPKVGDKVPDFKLKNLDDKTVKLSDFFGKKIFVLELGACT
jgi:cytochrome oxidase Cu insertion factor (SCO1/SenC/PrrC family)